MYVLMYFYKYFLSIKKIVYTQYPLIKNTFIKNDWLNTKVLKNRHQSILNEIKNTFLSQTSQNFQLKERHLCFKNIHKFVSRNIFFFYYLAVIIIGRKTLIINFVAPPGIILSYYYWQKNPYRQFCSTSGDNFILFYMFCVRQPKIKNDYLKKSNF